ncbi:HAD-IA family hydrolase [Streptomyces sp. NPDC093707]|uniref:HAD-IA family hydrolase n=1 Tax=Streptomyces sp. NPDC093707 TaxID=3154984 RepID=UPI00344FFEBA
MKFSVDALLFDSDETLVSSLASVSRCWTRWAIAHGLTLADVLAVRPHGRPAAAIVADLLPSERVAAALAELQQAEVDDAVAGGVVPVPGSRELLASLPSHRWAVVTSGTRRVANARLSAAGLDVAYLVAVDDVTRHKPHPEPFLTAARLLGVDPARCIAFEDAPAGLEAARAAGMTTVALTTTHAADDLASGADAVIPDLSAVTVRRTDTGIDVTVAV